LPLGSGASGCLSSKAHLPTSACFRSRPNRPSCRRGLRTISGQLCSAPRVEAGTSSGVFLQPFGLPALASWVSCPLQGIGLPSRSAYRASLVRSRTLEGFPCSARMRCDRARVSSIPRGPRCPHDCNASTVAACRFTAAQSLRVRHCYPTRTLRLTRHQQGFPLGHPPQPSPRLWPPDGAETLGLFRGLRTQPLPATHATVGTDPDTGPELLRRPPGRPPQDQLTPNVQLHVAMHPADALRDGDQEPSASPMIPAHKGIRAFSLRSRPP